jgi:hypothetical protein
MPKPAISSTKITTDQIRRRLPPARSVGDGGRLIHGRGAAIRGPVGDLWNELPSF